jgi:hypothetical protein
MGAIRQRRDALAAEITQGETDADGKAFADAKQLELIARADSVKAAIASPAAAADPQAEQLRDRARLATGALTWQLAQDMNGRVWNAKKEVQIIDEQLAETQRLDTALSQAQSDEPTRFDVFEKRIAAIKPMLDVMIPRVASLTKEQQGIVQDIAVAELSRQQERLAIYSTQARFAVAQLYDRANARATDKTGDEQHSEKGADHAATKR